MIIYIGKTAIVLAVFYIFYRLLLSKETFHRFNRIVLLGTAALSFILPFCIITIEKAVPASEFTFAEGTVPEQTASDPLWQTVLCILFFVGTAAVLINTMISVGKILEIIRKCTHKKLDSGETLILTDSDTAPFSWMKYIIMSNEDHENGSGYILTHEKAHIALRHSWDILFVDIITAFQWFNPAIWMLRSDLRTLHEFEADDAVLKSGADIREYQYLLIRKAVGRSGYSVANCFNHSTLKQRISMMLNPRSSYKNTWKALYIIPIVGISLTAAAKTIYIPMVEVDIRDRSDILYVIDGKKITDNSAVKDIDPDSIKHVLVLKDERAVREYGKEAENGVVIIDTGSRH